MLWVEVLAVLVLSHVVGDYVLQTDWQAVNKRGGLGRRPVPRRALSAHILTYTLAFVPALVWIYASLGPAAVGLLALIAVPHAIQDDGRLLEGYARRVKGMDPAAEPAVMAQLDQTFHAVALFAVSLLASAL